MTRTSPTFGETAQAMTAFLIDGVAPEDAKTSPSVRMNRMYRYQRHIYDATRRHYLLGRDEAITGLAPAPGQSVLEIGCGTGRNLIQAAKKFPQARLFGVDVSTEMLTSAIAAIESAGLDGRVRVAHGDASTFDPMPLFGTGGFDRVLISYSLSMITDWRGALAAAVALLNRGGELHAVDFGDQRDLPRIARALLRRWLAAFDVTPRDELESAMQSLAQSRGATLQSTRPFRGYAQHFAMRLPDGSLTAVSRAS